jgi:hypothetical protein
MLRALFSTRYLQQLLREGKLTKEYLYFFTILIYLVTFPSLLMAFFYFYFPETIVTFSYPILFYLFLSAVTVVAQQLSRIFLQYFTTIFNYQEQKYLYLSAKALYRFYHTLLLVSFIPVVWYARLPSLIFFGYIPLLIVIFITFFIRFLRNINGT